MTRPPDDYASRAGTKLNHALESFNVELRGRCCADLGSNAGGFVDCLLRNGAAKVYAVERGFGVLNYRLRADARVTVMERTDARHLRRLPPRVSKTNKSPRGCLVSRQLVARWRTRFLPASAAVR